MQRVRPARTFAARVFAYRSPPGAMRPDIQQLQADILGGISVIRDC